MKRNTLAVKKGIVLVAIGTMVVASYLLSACAKTPKEESVYDTEMDTEIETSDTTLVEDAEVNSTMDDTEDILVDLEDAADENSSAEETAQVPDNKKDEAQSNSASNKKDTTTNNSTTTSGGSSTSNTTVSASDSTTTSSKPSSGATNTQGTTSNSGASTTASNTNSSAGISSQDVEEDHKCSFYLPRFEEQDVWVVDQAAYDENIYGDHNVCNGCGYIYPEDKEAFAHDWHSANCGEYGASWSLIPYVKEVVHHDEVGHYEKQQVCVGHYCMDCGAKKTIY